MPPLCCRPEYRKSIRRQTIEGEFLNLLGELTPAPKLTALLRAMFEDAWAQRHEHAATAMEAAEIAPQAGS